MYFIATFAFVRLNTRSQPALDQPQTVTFQELADHFSLTEGGSVGIFSAVFRHEQEALVELRRHRVQLANTAGSWSLHWGGCRRQPVASAFR